MGTLYKTAEHVEFERRFRELPWPKRGKASRVAEELGISRAAVSMYLRGGTSKPSERTLKDLKKLVERESSQPAAGVIVAPEVTESPREKADRKLNELENKAPEFLEAALASIDAIHQTALSSKGVYSGEVAPASASAVARRELQESQRKRGADVPSGRKRGRGRGAGPGSTRKPGTPGPAQE